MQNLLVIGNGFDLNLGLPTSYKDFTNSPEYHPILRSRNIMGVELHNRCQTCKWIDIENELKMYSREYPIPEKLEEHFDELKECLKNYLASIDVGRMNKQALAYQMVKGLISTDFLILDFNYTDTTKRILQDLGVVQSQIDARLKKVHGTIAHDNIIFGVEDSADIDLENHIFLKKSSALNFQGIELTDYLAEQTNLHIFGHSLGETDRTYFQSYFDKALSYQPTSKNAPMGKVVLYHYGIKGWHSLIKQIDAMTGQQNNVYRNKVKLHLVDSSKPPSALNKVA